MKKVFGLFALTIFLMSMSNSVNIPVEKEADCTEDTLDVMDFTGALGFNQATVECVGNLFLAECMGYSVNYDDCF